MISPVYMLMTFLFMGLGSLVSWMLKKRFEEYSQMPIRLTGKEVAEKMLRDNGIYDVQVVSVPGQLTDHYNPATKTVNLSEAVCHQSNVAAAAVAAHECGHAVQDAQSYAFLQMRSMMVPAVQISTNLSQILLSLGVMLMFMSGIKIVLFVGVVLFALSTLFSLVTLPVEFDASSRALTWIRSSNVLGFEQQDKAFTALKWAALTYVVAALASLASLLYYASMLFGRRND